MRAESIDELRAVLREHSPDWMPRLRNLIDEAPIGLAYADAAGRCLWANKTLCDWTGMDRAKLVNGARWHFCKGVWSRRTVLQCREPECQERALAYARGESSTAVVETVFPAVGGRARTLLVKRHPDTSPDGTHLGTYLVMIELPQPILESVKPGRPTLVHD